MQMSKINQLNIEIRGSLNFVFTIHQTICDQVYLLEGVKAESEQPSALKMETGVIGQFPVNIYFEEDAKGRWLDILGNIQDVVNQSSPEAKWSKPPVGFDHKDLVNIRLTNQ